VQCRARHATGSWLVFEIVAYNLLDHPEARGIVVNGREISERQQREVEKDPLMEELKESHDGWSMSSGLLCVCASCKKIQKKVEAGAKSKRTSATAHRSNSPMA